MDKKIYYYNVLFEIGFKLFFSFVTQSKHGPLKSALCGIQILYLVFIWADGQNMILLIKLTDFKISYETKELFFCYVCLSSITACFMYNQHYA